MPNLFRSFLNLFSVLFLFSALDSVYSEPWSCPREQASGTYQRQRLIAQLTSFSEILSLVLVCVGLDGVTVYNVGRRTSEIGVERAALPPKRPRRSREWPLVSWLDFLWL